MPRDTHEDASVLTRLVGNRTGADKGFLEPHHLVAAERFERLVQRAQVSQRVTMSYDVASIGQRGGGGNQVETASEGAAAARQRLNTLAAAMPKDCWGVLFDVCGLGKGLQTIETERRWPRRSAKLVLRIGLDQLAAQFGLSPQGLGGKTAPQRNWLDERLPLIPVNRA